jgi:hypothetical protein
MTAHSGIAHLDVQRATGHVLFKCPITGRPKAGEEIRTSLLKFSYRISLPLEKRRHTEKTVFEKVSHGHVEIKARRPFVASPAGWSHNRAALALPDVLTAGAGDRLHGMFLLQHLLTNWTISLTHIHTWLFPYEWSG